VDLPARIGRYEIELLLGEGGCGRVFLARDPVLGRPVAVKVLRDDFGTTPELRRALAEQVRQETRAAATLSHPGIVALHDMGEDERVGLYVVFELVRGPTLRERLHEGPLSPAEVAQIVTALGSAVSHAHGAGLVHRGVRPENIMLAATGPRLTDLGFCCGEIRAPGYSAPEVLSGDSFGVASDEFSLAATMYEALTGVPAFAGQDPAAVAASVAAGTYAAPKSVLPALRGFVRLDAIFARALARRPKDRFPTCDAFAFALAAELKGPRIAFLATPGSFRSSATRATRRWQNRVALVAVAVILALIVIGRLQQRGSVASMQRVAPPPASHSLSPSFSTATSASPSSSASAGAALERRETPDNSVARDRATRAVETARKSTPPFVDP
jgi:eukaryotic-like serine/threonine-protein kinase